MNRNRVRRFLASIAAALALAGASVGAAHAAAVSALPNDLRTTAWQDSDGASFRLVDTQAPLVVLTMSYTACKRVCSSTALVLADLQKRLDAAQRSAEFVVVSFDPQNDSPQQWREYRARRGLTRANWHFLSGDAVATKKLARLLDLDFWDYHGHIVHDFRIVVLDARGQVITEVDWQHMDELPARLGLDGVPPTAAAPR